MKSRARRLRKRLRTASRAGWQSRFFSSGGRSSGRPPFTVSTVAQIEEQRAYMQTPTLLQMAFAYLLLVSIFTFGTYATYRLFEGHPITRFMFWSFVGMVFVGAVL